MSELKENKSFVNFTEKEWTEFLSHRMSPEKEAEFIRLSQQQVFSSESLEGIESVPNRSHVLSAINQINHKIKERSGKSTSHVMKSNEFNYVRIGAIAAVFVILIGIGSGVIYLMNNVSNSSVASVTAESTENPESLLPPAISSDATISSSQGADSINRLPLTTIVDTSKSQSIKPNPLATSIDKSTQTQKPATTNSGLTKPTLAVKSKNLVGVGDSKAMAPPVANQSRTGYTSASELELSTAPNNSVSLTLSEVIADKKVIIPKDDQNSNITQYQKGIEEMNNGNNDEALKNFDNVIKQNSGFKVDAKWNKAQILIKKGDTKKAVKILKELAENENPYKNKAKDLLKTLE